MALITKRIRESLSHRLRPRLLVSSSSHRSVGTITTTTATTIRTPTKGKRSNDSNEGVPTEVEVESTSIGSTASDATGISSVLEDDDIATPLIVPAMTRSSYRGHPRSRRHRHRRNDKDPYYDVRETLEALSLRDQTRFALHSDGSSQANNKSKASVSQHHVQEEEVVSWFIAYTCYLGYLVMFLIGHFRGVCAKFFGGRFHKTHVTYPSDDPNRYAALLISWEYFYACRVYSRVQDCFNRPIASPPGATLHVLERISRDGQKSMELYGGIGGDMDDDEYTRGEHFVMTHDGKVARKCLNLGSYNYLGFADDWHKTCSTEVKAALSDYPVSTASSLNDYGRTELHRQMDDLVANFVGKEDAICLNMGFNTNATVIPSLVGPGDLVISDELNHNSIVNGARASGAAIRTFRHNDTKNLEAIVREAILMGRPRMHRPWNKILVIVEGIYSMEGEYCDLKNVVRICKQYGAYLYLDEAHSIGAMGHTGRGCAEYAGVNPADIDIMMGTFTKSFGALGGYIASSYETIAFLRKRCAGSVYHNSISPVVCQQVLSALKVISGADGTSRGERKLQALRDNTNYFRMRLKEMGLIVLGQYDSPVVPVMIYNISKIGAFSRECFKRGLAVVVVGFPAVPVLMARARFCVSAGHTREDLDRALREIDEIADIVDIRYRKRTKIA